jgi:hypothetical protein
MKLAKIIFLCLLVSAGIARAQDAWQQPVMPDGYSVGEEPSPEDNEEELPPSDETAEELNEELVESPTPKWIATKEAKVKALNKVLTRNKEIKIKTGGSQKFGSLSIAVEKCFKADDSDKEESSALIKITETLSNGTTKQAFHAWMFSSSPAISALEHPIYDVILLSCSDEQKKEEPKPEDKKDDKKKDEAKKPNKKRN